VKQTSCSPDPYPVTPGTSPGLAISSTRAVELEFAEGGQATGLDIPVHNGIRSFEDGDIADGTSPAAAPVPGPLGVTQPGHVVSFTYPASGFLDTTLLFVQHGHNTFECGNPDAVAEGSTTTPAQLDAIFGSTTPTFSVKTPLLAVACYSGPNPTPSFITLPMSVVFDS